MSVDDTLEKRLSEPFPPQVLGTLKKGGASLTYAPVAEVITRLNRVLGVGNWSCTTVNCNRDPIETDWVIAHVRLTANLGGQLASFDGHGGVQIKRTKEGKPVDLGDEFKGAESDALKKAATRLGIALDLARKEDALRYEAQQEAEEQNAPGDPVVLAQIEADIAKLEDGPKAAFRSWWKDNKLPKPSTLPARLVPDVRSALDLFLERQAQEQAKQPSSAPSVPAEPEAAALAAVGAAFPGAENVDNGRPFE